MADAMKFVIGAGAECSDGPCGEVRRVVVDPVSVSVTHIVVEPKHRQALGRLVPLELIESMSENVHLSCTSEEFDKLEVAEEAQFLSLATGYQNYDMGEVLYHPYYVMGVGGIGSGMNDPGSDHMSVPIVTDVLPIGEVAVRRNECVHSTDGDIGKVHGLVVGQQDHHVTHILLQEGHLWGKKMVAIPVSAVVSMDGGIKLNLSKSEIGDLPPMDVEHPIGASSGS
jgi:hypothetical protein